MAQIITIKGDKREVSSKDSAHLLRDKGSVPAIIYGNKTDPLPIALNLLDLEKEIKKQGFFSKQLQIEINGSTERVLPREIQFHPVNQKILHIDFLRISDTTKINVSVGVIFLNEEESPGLKRGGVINIVKREIELIGPVVKIPEKIEVDLTGLDIGDSVHIGGIKLPEGVTPTITDRDFTIASIAAPTVVEEVEEKPEEEEGEEEEGEEKAEGTTEEESEGDKEDSGKKEEQKKPEENKK